jgi:hypothetical protein
VEHLLPGLPENGDTNNDRIHALYWSLLILFIYCRVNVVNSSGYLSQCRGITSEWWPEKDVKGGDRVLMRRKMIHSPAGTEENHAKRQWGWLVLIPRFEPGTSWKYIQPLIQGHCLFTAIFGGTLGCDCTWAIVDFASCHPVRKMFGSCEVSLSYSCNALHGLINAKWCFETSATTRPNTQLKTHKH